LYVVSKFRCNGLTHLHRLGYGVLQLIIIKEEK
jgi:hypothetical protein